MTATAETATASRRTAPAKQPKPPKPESRVRSKPRPPTIIALAIALIIVAGLAGAWVYTTTGQTVQVFSAGADIARGDIIESGDLVAVEIPEADDPLLRRGTRRRSHRPVRRRRYPPPGHPDQPEQHRRHRRDRRGRIACRYLPHPSAAPAVPARQRRPGAHRRDPDQPGDPPATTPPSIKATIVSVSQDETSGNTVVAVAVDEDRAADLAARAATGRVALVLDSLGE